MNKELYIPVNEYQTPVDGSLHDRYPVEVVDQMVDYINSVPYIRHLISPDRPRARDLPRDEEGKIIVDLCHPHILEDMDYFRETAIHFQAHGCFTSLRCNRHPHSEYMQWYRRELTRIWEGMVRPGDGEWIPGELYFFLNYMIMSQTRISYSARGRRHAEKIDDLPESWESIYLRFHYHHQARLGGKYDEEGGLHAAEVSSRGKGKSFSLAAICARAFLFGLHQGNSTSVKTLVVANDSETLMKDGTLTKFLSCISFLADRTEFPASRIKEDTTGMYWIAGYLDPSRNPRGSQNEVMGVALGGDPDKTRGKRVALMLFDEFGKAPNYTRWYSVSRPNVQEGAVSFGQSISVGTGGTEGANFEGALDVISSPKSNFVYGIPNYYDRGSAGTTTTVFFTPSFLNYKPFYNKDGVSDVIAAMLHELNIRHKIKYNSPDTLKLTQQRAEYAFTLQDAIMRRDGTLFPVADLNDRVNYLDTHPGILQGMYTGRLGLENGEVSFIPDDNLKPVISYPHKDNKIKGCVYISEMPVKDSRGQVPSDRYISGCDPVAVDQAESLSLFACHVLDMYTDRVVACYVGRENFVDDSFEIARRLLLFYNARCNYENNKNGLFKYMSQHGCLYLLTDNLEYLQNRDNPYIRVGNARKGTPSSAPTREYGLRCLREYLIKPVVTVETDEDGNDHETSIKTLETIPFRSLLQELASWNPEGNFDEVDSMLMLMLLREDRLRLLGDGNFQDSAVDDKNYLGNDRFFMTNYDRRGDANSKALEMLRKAGVIKARQ